MKKINPYRCDNFAEYNSVVAKKSNQSEKILLSNVSSKVDNRYKEYEDNTSSLEMIGLISWEKENAKALRNLVNSRTYFSTLKRKIRQLSKNGKCMYCDFSEHDPLDHYLPKNPYPEFSIFSLNLIPSCSRCNRLKHDEIFINGKRVYLNPYFDAIDEKQYVVCDIYFKGSNLPTPEFSIESYKGDTLAEIFLTHFEKLSLKERYENEANELITNWVSRAAQIKNISGDFNTNMKNLIRVDLNADKTRFGINNWRYAVEKAMIESDKFIEYCKNAV